MNEIDIAGNLRIASPCNESWERMVGDERVRHCDSCQRNVYNLSEMTRKEVEELVLRTEGKMCTRMYRRLDGTVLTRDCPVGLKAVRLRVAKFAGAVFATLLSVCSISFSQNKDEKQSPRQSTYKIESISQETNGRLAGTIVDIQGAVIANAEITLGRPDATEKKVVSNDYGEFVFTDLADGEYSLIAKSVGFTELNAAKLQIKGNQSYRIKVTLEVAALLGETVIILRDSTDRKPMDLEQLKKLPIKN